MKSKVLEVKNKALLKVHRNEILKIGKGAGRGGHSVTIRGNLTNGKGGTAEASE